MPRRTSEYPRESDGDDHHDEKSLHDGGDHAHERQEQQYGDEGDDDERHGLHVSHFYPFRKPIVRQNLRRGQYAGIVMRRLLVAGVVSLATAVAAILPATGASATSTSTVLHVSAIVPSALAPNLPLARLHFSAPTAASSLPPLVTRPALATQWQQIGPRDVQAVAVGALEPLTSYVFDTPTVVSCSTTCTVDAFQTHVASVATNLTWEAQLLAELKYLPVSFTPGTVQSDAAQPVNGTYAWSYPNLPTVLRDQWSLGTDNVILRAALMTFQSQSSLLVSGYADPTTWTELVNAANARRVDPATYDFVDVSKTLPEHLTLYVSGKAIFHTPVNTGIPVDPTATGTYPVYLRYLTQTMQGTNPNGTHYSDSGIPDVSYFNGGDALHGFIRASYGFPQSLGCVEMPFASAKTVFPYTPIGTLVTVQA